MKLANFDFKLPTDLIAQYPVNKRTMSKLLVFNKVIIDKYFHQIIDYLLPNDLLVLNNTKVIPARIFANKITGGKVEIMLERVIAKDKAIAMIRASKAPHIGSKITLESGNEIIIVDKYNEFYILKFDTSINQITNKIGHIPLPPYIKRNDENIDNLRYQSVFAQEKGAVAAPTASLHFDKALLKKIKNKGIDTAFVTLHIGAGTFAPVKVDDITKHKIHSEYFSIDKEAINKIKATKKNGGRVICVGTTAMRVVETAACNDLKASSGDTNIFIYPGFDFKIADGLVTNFHLPKSSLLMLVGAFIGMDEMHKIYQYAIANKYRFFSYGDAMLLLKKAN